MINKVLYILGQLSDEDADWLGSVGSRVRLNRGATLIERGVQLQNLYFVLEGELQVLSPRRDEIARVSVGDILGELSLLDENLTSADVVAVTPVNILSVSHAMIFHRISIDAEFSTRFYKALSMLLALRMRATLSRFGAGDEPKTVIPPDDDDARNLANANEIPLQRFERMIRALMGIKASPRR